jgi:hypothetical protein
MKSFRYSRIEYFNNAKRCLKSQNRIEKALQLSRTGQTDTTCNVTLHGYPAVPLKTDSERMLENQEFSPFMRDFNDELPQLIAL